MNGLDISMASPQPTAQRPLLGVTVLMVEDSRFACEAVRMLCLRSGARIRRADTLASARKHLANYRPTVVIVDLGLPDGSGLELIADLARAVPRIDVILATSGDLGMEAAAAEAGADGYLSKPLASLAVFQAEILRHLPDDQQPPSPRVVKDVIVTPDPVALHDDLSHVAEVLRVPGDDTAIAYVTQFLGGVARSAKDRALNDAVAKLESARSSGRAVQPVLTRLTDLVQSRLDASGPI